MRLHPSLPQTARFSPHREYESVRLLAGARWDGPSFKAALAHSAALDGPWRYLSRFVPKGRIIELFVPPMRKTAALKIPIPLFPFFQAPASCSFASGTLNLLLAKGFKAHFALRNDFDSRGIMRFLRLPDTQIRGKQNSAQQIP